MRVAIYGNLIYDQITTVQEPFVIGNSHNCELSHSAGGIANFCRAGNGLFDMSVKSKIGKDQYGLFLHDEIKKHATSFVEETSYPTSFANIIVDKTNCTRTGMVRWGACRIGSRWNAVYATWHHIMYLDRINISPKELESFKGTISADLCTVEDIDSYRHLLPHIDYLIVSDGVDSNGLRIGFQDKYLRKGIIVHSPNRIFYRIGENVDHYDIIKEEKLNVLGAGDYLAAFTIANLLVNRLPDLKEIHQQTLNMLEQQS